MKGIILLNTSGLGKRLPKLPFLQLQEHKIRLLDFQENLRKTVATIWHFRLKYTNFVVGWASAPERDRGAYSAPPDALAGSNRPYF